MRLDQDVRAESDEFESEVRRVASQLWPRGVPGNAVKLDGFERDALYVTDDVAGLVYRIAPPST